MRKSKPEPVRSETDKAAEELQDSIRDYRINGGTKKQIKICTHKLLKHMVAELAQGM